MDQVRIDVVFLQEDRDAVDEIVVRVATRILEKAKINQILANPISMEIIRTYLYHTFRAVCEREGIDISNIPTLKNENTALTVKTRH